MSEQFRLGDQVLLKGPARPTIIRVKHLGKPGVTVDEDLVYYRDGTFWHYDSAKRYVGAIGILEGFHPHKLHLARVQWTHMPADLVGPHYLTYAPVDSLELLHRPAYIDPLDENETRFGALRPLA